MQGNELSGQNYPGSTIRQQPGGEITPVGGKGSPVPKEPGVWEGQLSWVRISHQGLTFDLTVRLPLSSARFLFAQPQAGQPGSPDHKEYLLFGTGTLSPVHHQPPLCAEQGTSLGRV